MYSSEPFKRRVKVIFSALFRLISVGLLLYNNPRLFISVIIYKLLCIWIFILSLVNKVILLKFGE